MSDLKALSNADLLAGIVAQARKDALREAHGAVAILEGKWSESWRAGRKCNSHMEGQSDGASECLAAITALMEADT